MVGMSASLAGREPTMDPRPARRGSTVSILVVEDDHAVAELLREVFHDIDGWAATVAHDAAAARQVFEQVTIDVLLLDVNLPGISGLELLELLRRDLTWHEPPVIVLSANPDQPGIKEAVGQGNVTRFIPKPFDVDDVVDTIRRALRET